MTCADNLLLERSKRIDRLPLVSFKRNLGLKNRESKVAVVSRSLDSQALPKRPEFQRSSQNRIPIKPTAQVANQELLITRSNGYTPVFEEFDEKCPRGEAIRSMKIRRVKINGKNDAQFDIQCQAIPLNVRVVSTFKIFMFT